MSALQEIPVAEWPVLRDLYDNHRNEASGYCTLQILINWLKQNSQEDVKIYSLNGDWREDGTYVAIIPEFLQVYCNTLSKDTTRLAEALRCIKLKKDFCICGFPERIRAGIKNHCPSNQLADDEKYTAWYHLSKAKVLSFAVDAPAGITLARLKLEHAAKVYNEWPKRAFSTIDFVKKLILYNDSVGAFDKNGELIGWCLIFPVASLAILQVHEQHKRKGLGSLLVRYLCKEMAKQDLEAMASVMLDNEASKGLFEKLGFEIVDYVSWISKHVGEQKAL